MSDSLRPHGLHSPWNSPGQNTGVGSLSLLLGIFPTQGSNPGLRHCGWILYQLSHRGSPDAKEPTFYSSNFYCVLSCFSRKQLSVTPWTIIRQAPLSMGLLGKNTGVGCHFLLQGVFPTQGSNPGLRHCRWILYPLSSADIEKKEK